MRRKMWVSTQVLRFHHSQSKLEPIKHLRLLQSHLMRERMQTAFIDSEDRSQMLVGVCTVWKKSLQQSIKSSSSMKYLWSLFIFSLTTVAIFILEDTVFYSFYINKTTFSNCKINRISEEKWIMNHSNRNTWNDFILLRKSVTITSRDRFEEFLMFFCLLSPGLPWGKFCSSVTESPYNALFFVAIKNPTAAPVAWITAGQM